MPLVFVVLNNVCVLLYGKVVLFQICFAVEIDRL